MPDEAKWLAKGACSQCGRPIAARASVPGPIVVACNVCKATTTLEAAGASTPANPAPSRASKRWSWPIVVAIVGVFFLVGLVASLLLGANGDPAAEEDPIFVPSTQATPNAATVAPTSTERALGEFARLYVNDTTGATHLATISLWVDDAERSRVVVNTTEKPTGPHMEIDPEGRAFELRVEGEAEGVTLVRPFGAPRCGTTFYEIELVIGEDGRFRWGNVGCAAVSSQL